MAARIPSDAFPFMRHRTLAEVARTDALLAKAERETLVSLEAHELALLLPKARHNNPPPEDDGQAA